MASFLYQAGLAQALKSVNLATATVKLMLVTSGYTPDQDDEFVADLTPGSNELSGTGYSRKTMTSLAVTANDTEDSVDFDADDETWTGINAGTAAAAVIFIYGTGDSDSYLLAYIDSGGFPAVTNGGDLTITWAAGGIFRISL